MREGALKRSSERVAEAIDGYAATTIPVHVNVDVEQTVLIQPEAEEILRTAEKIALGPCFCRKEAKKCAAPDRHAVLWLRRLCHQVPVRRDRARPKE